MAYLKVDHKSGEQYLRIVESKRVDGKPTKKTLYSLGKVSDYTPSMLKRFGERFYELGGGNPKELLGTDVEELDRYNYGYYQAVSKALAYYGLDKLLITIQKRKKLSYNLLNVVCLMLVERLHDPTSKRSNYLDQQEYLGIAPVELHHLYRSLDQLSAKTKVIQRCIFEKGRNLFNQKLDVVFYDVTTFYFDSDKEDNLRRKGFSKDGKTGKVQVVFGLLIDENKNPIGYRLYAGDQYEGHTFEDAVALLKKEYRIENIIVVADRGMLSKSNINIVEHQNNYEFIVGERLKTLPKSIKSELTNLKNYTKQWHYDKDGKVISLKYTALNYNGRTLIATYSSNRATKDKKDREDKIKKAEKLLQNPSQIERRSARFYLKKEHNSKYSIDVEKIKQDQKYDGFLCIATNNKTLQITTILDHYRHLFQIEQTFRTFKAHLETRPMYHWTPKRIEGHICLCYMAYTTQHYLLSKLNKNGCKVSENQLRKNLDRMQVSLVKQKNELFYLRSANKNDIPAIVNKLGLKRIPNILPKQQITSYL
jgi:transposase